jgi:hypothetical protein
LQTASGSRHQASGQVNTVVDDASRRKRLQTANG